MPAELDDMNRNIMQLEIEEAALKEKDDKLSKQRLAALQKELAELRDSFNGNEGTVGEREERHRARCRSCARKSRTTKAEIEKAERD